MLSVEYKHLTDIYTRRHTSLLFTSCSDHGTRKTKLEEEVAFFTSV